MSPLTKKPKPAPRPKGAGTKAQSDASHTKSAKRTKKQFHMPLTVSNPELLDENGKSDRKFRQLLYDFSALGFYLEFAREYLAGQIGLSAPQYNCLMIVAQYQGSAGISVTEVALHLHVSIAFVTGEIGKLERARLVDKRRNPEDGRGVLLRLTTKGKLQVMQLKPQLQFVNDRLFGSLNAVDFRMLAKTAADLIEHFAATTEALKQAQQEASQPAGGTRNE